MGSINRPKQKKWVPTQADLILLKGYSAIRLPVPQICALLKVNQRTLEMEMKKNSAVRDAIESGRAGASSTVRRTLFEMATVEKKFEALKFWCQTQEGFKTVNQTELSGPDGQPIATAQLSKEERKAEIDRLIAIRNAGMLEHSDED